MKELSILLIMLFLSNVKISGQIELVRGDKHSVIDKDKFLNVGFLGDPEDECFNRIYYLGKYVRSYGDSIEMRLDSEESTVLQNEVENKHIINYKSEGDIFVDKRIHKNDIRYVEVYKNLKHKESKDKFKIAGGVLLLTGLVTATSVLVTKKDSRSNILIYSGAQVGLGTLFLVLSSKKDYLVNGDEEDPWMIK